MTPFVFGFFQKVLVRIRICGLGTVLFCQKSLERTNRNRLIDRATATGVFARS
jgi:hypothetical protein